MRVRTELTNSVSVEKKRKRNVKKNFHLVLETFEERTPFLSFYQTALTTTQTATATATAATATTLTHIKQVSEWTKFLSPFF